MQPLTAESPSIRASMSTAEYSVDGFESPPSGSIRGSIVNFADSHQEQQLQQQEEVLQQQQEQVEASVIAIGADGGEPVVLVPAPYEVRSQHERKSRLIQTQSADTPTFQIVPKPGIPGGNGGGGNDGQTSAAPNGNSNGAKQRSGKNDKSGKGKGSKKSDPAKHSEFYMPVDLRERMLHRSMEVLRANDETTQRLNTLVQTQQRVKLDDLRKCHEEEGFKLKKKRACGLCEVKFSEVNLPVAVTIKAIYDLRHTWMLRREAQLVAAREAELAKPGGGDAEAKGVGGGGSVMTSSSVTSMAAKAAENKVEAKRVMQLVQNGALLQPSRSYDQKRVCSFCAQFFDSDELYRPSFGAKLAKLQEEKRQKELADDQKYWDPLMNPIRTVDTTSKKARQRAHQRQLRLELEHSVRRTEILRLGSSASSTPNASGGGGGGGGGGTGGGKGMMMPRAGDPAGGPFFVAVAAASKTPGQQPGTAVHGHGAVKDSQQAVTNKGLLELEKEKEALAFAEAAKKSAFWHAAVSSVCGLFFYRFFFN
jgi:type II secretory pathway pseudopilin PulG